MAPSSARAFSASTGSLKSNCAKTAGRIHITATLLWLRLTCGKLKTLQRPAAETLSGDKSRLPCSSDTLLVFEYVQTTRKHLAAGGRLVTLKCSAKRSSSSKHPRPKVSEERQTGIAWIKSANAGIEARTDVTKCGFA